MSARFRIALIGERSASVAAHAAIDRCLAAVESRGIVGDWLSTTAVGSDAEPVLRGCSGLWVVPGSPYLNTAGALAAIRYARVGGLPFLGTCGGFQHALLERARNVLARPELGHEEQDPGAAAYLISRLPCSLVAQTRNITALPGTRYEKLCGEPPRTERFQCNFGLNPEYESLLPSAGLQVAARDESGQMRAFEDVSGHPFFMGTLFQPERRVLDGDLHPLVSGFFEAVSKMG